MRKDVKIGLTIGGVLLAVLIVYLLVPKNNDGNQLARDTSSSSTSDQRQEGAEAGTGGSPSTLSTPVTGSQDSSPGASQQPPQPSNEAHAAPDRPVQDAPQPPAEAPNGALKSVDWETIVHTGRIPDEARIPLVGTNGSRAETDVFGEAPKTGANGGPEINWQGAGGTPPAPPGGAAPKPAAPATPATPKGTPKEHVIQPGEHLSSISLALYGDARHYKEILKANPGLDERKLKPGTKINIPDPSTFTTPKAQQAVARLEPSIDPAKEYRVAPGDSLHKIAMKLYGKAAKADDLYELNKEKIGDDSARVKVGMVLKLPEPPTSNLSQSSR